MAVTTFIKVNLGLALLASLAHVPGLFFLDSSPTNSEVSIYILWLIVFFEVSIIISSIIGLNNTFVIWKILAYQSVLMGVASIWIGYKVIDYAIFGFENENFSFSIGLTTAFCVYSALLISKTCDHYFRRSCRHLAWVVGFVIGLSEILMIIRFMELRDSLSSSLEF